jgi:hypothetical protein
MYMFSWGLRKTYFYNNIASHRGLEPNRGLSNCGLKGPEAARIRPRKDPCDPKGQTTKLPPHDFELRVVAVRLRLEGPQNGPESTPERPIRPPADEI